MRRHSRAALEPAAASQAAAAARAASSVECLNLEPALARAALVGRQPRGLYSVNLSSVRG